MIGKPSKPLQRFEEESKYEGPEILDPKTPYHVDYAPRKVDRSQKFVKKVTEKVTYMYEDFLVYAQDAIKGITDVFNYKTAYFLKRNLKSLSHTVGHNAHHIWDELKKVGYGFKLLN